LSAFRDDIDQFGELDAAVVTVNPASVAAHERWAAKMGFNFPLLSDPDRQVCAAYQVLKENGKSVQRTVYIVDKQGVIRYAKQGMPPDSELLEVLRGLQG
jgi:peroxiredoxin Q/BCP